MKVKELKDILNKLDEEEEVFFAEPIKLNPVSELISYRIYYSEILYMRLDEKNFLFRKLALEDVNLDTKIAQLLYKSKK